MKNVLAQIRIKTQNAWLIMKNRFLLFCLAFFCLPIINSLAQISLEVSELDISIPNATSFELNSFNNQYQITGTAHYSGNVTRAFIYENGDIQLLPLPVGYTSTSAAAINDNGSICGLIIQTEGSVEHAFIYQSGAFNILGTFGGNFSAANDINSADIVVGGAALSNDYVNAFLYDGTLNDIGNLGGPYCTATSVNNFNTVVGWCQMPWGYNNAFVYKNGSMTNLGTSGGFDISQATDINNLGQVTITADNGAYKWEDGAGFMQLPQYPGANFHEALAINNNGLIAGRINQFTSCIWVYNSILIIDSLITSPGWHIVEVLDINDNDQLLCSAQNGNNNTFVILTLGGGEAVTKPSSSELVVSKEPYEIKWQNVSYNTLKIEFSADGGTNYSEIANGISGSANSYLWTAADTISSNCRIRLVDENDSANVVKSSRFKVKGYVLTRFGPYPDLEYEIFDPANDGWSFINDSAHIYPQEWWQQFDYITANDPYTGTHTILMIFLFYIMHNLTTSLIGHCLSRRSAGINVI